MGPLLSQIRGFGLAFTPEQIEKTRALYIPHVPKPTPDIATVTRDVKYGPHERNRLDVFAPAAGVKGAPVAMFVHGGGFVMGDKGDADAPFFNNFGAWAAKNGMVGVTMTYRLAPDHKYPAGSEDVAAAVRWLRDNIAAHGGDPGDVTPIGHSAGAAHVAGYIAHPDLKAEAARSIARAVLISGVLDVEHSDQNPMHHAYYGDDAGRYPGQSSVPGLVETDIPLLLTLSEYDPAEFQRIAAYAVGERARKKGAWPSFLWMKGHNHVSPSMQIGTDEDTLGPALLEFIKRQAGARG